MLISLGTKAIVSFFPDDDEDEDEDEDEEPLLPPHPASTIRKITHSVEISANLLEECIIGVISFCPVGLALWELNDICSVVANNVPFQCTSLWVIPKCFAATLSRTARSSAARERGGVEAGGIQAAPVCLQPPHHLSREAPQAR